MANRTTFRVIYTGRVQGVGFRWNTREIARQFPVTGYVRNLPDGTVELVACGAAESVQDLMDAVARRFRDHISNTNAQPLGTTEEFESFEIRHGTD